MLAGCGSEAEEVPPPEQVAAEFVDASIRGEIERACGLITAERRSQAGPECQDPRQPPRVPEDLSLDVVEAEQSGRTASVSIVVSGSGEEGTESARYELELVQDGETWRVDDSVAEAEPELGQDLDAKAGARTGQAAIETYAAGNGGSYAGATGLRLLRIEPALREARLTIPVADPSAYTLVTTSASGTKFRIKRLQGGEVVLSCDAPGTGGCPESGDWSEAASP